MSTFANRLKQLREERGFSQEKIGKQIGVSRYAVYTYEKEKAFPTAEGLIALADFFEVSTDYLLGRTDNPHWEG